MPSNTQISKRKRRRKAAKLGRDNKKERVKAGTPKFPVHVDAAKK